MRTCRAMGLLGDIYQGDSGGEAARRANIRERQCTLYSPTYTAEEVFELASPRVVVESRITCCSRHAGGLTQILGLPICISSHPALLSTRRLCHTRHQSAVGWLYFEFTLQQRVIPLANRENIWFLYGLFYFFHAHLTLFSPRRLGKG